MSPSLLGSDHEFCHCQTLPVACNHIYSTFLTQNFLQTCYASRSHCLLALQPSSRIAQPSLKIIVFLPGTNAPILWAITFFHSFIPRMSFFSFALCGLISIPSTLFNESLQRPSFPRLFWECTCEWLNYITYIKSILLIIHYKRPRRMTTDMRAVEWDQLHHTANPGWPE